MTFDVEILPEVHVSVVWALVAIARMDVEYLSRLIPKRKEGSGAHKPTHLVLWGKGRNRVSRPRLDTICEVNPLIS